MARSNGRQPRQSQPLVDALERLPPEFLHSIAEALEILKARPGATCAVINPAWPSTPATPREALKWVNAVKKGKPVPFTVDYLDGTPPVTIEKPLSSKPPREPRPAHRPRHPLTVARFVRFEKDHEAENLSERQLAKRLTIALRAELGESAKPVTRAIVRARRKEAEVARQRRSERRHSESNPPRKSPGLKLTGRWF